MTKQIKHVVIGDGRSANDIIKLLESGDFNVVVTGQQGTGKTAALRQLLNREHGNDSIVVIESTTEAKQTEGRTILMDELHERLNSKPSVTLIESSNAE